MSYTFYLKNSNSLVQNQNKDNNYQYNSNQPVINYYDFNQNENNFIYNTTNHSKENLEKQQIHLSTERSKHETEKDIEFIKNNTNIVHDKYIPIIPDQDKLLTSNFSFEKLKNSNSITSPLKYNINNSKFENYYNNTNSLENSLNLSHSKIIRDYSCLNKTKNKNSSCEYLDRKHIHETERINKMRFEKLQNEYATLRDKPLISQNSKKLLVYKKEQGQDVFLRLTDKANVIYVVKIKCRKQEKGKNLKNSKIYTIKTQGILI
jgi:hypothetical protein